MKNNKHTKSTALVVKQQTTPEALIMQAVNKGVNVETMERLLVIRREVKAEAAKEAFNFAMSSFQSECPIIKKNKKVLNKKEKGGGLRYAFASLDYIVEQVRPIMHRYRLSYTIDAEVDDKWVRATCKVTHELGHSDTSTFKVPVDAEAYMTQPQKFAAALTFAKRYAFCNAFGILTGDDDNDAQEGGPKRTTKELDTEEKFVVAMTMIKSCKNIDTVNRYYKDISEKGPKVYNEAQMADLINALIQRIEELK